MHSNYPGKQLRKYMRALAGAGLGLALLAAPRMAAAQTTTFFGSLFNFDVYNDTGEVAHGFEIELDGVANPPVSFFPSRYGFPTVVPFAGGYYVRYESPWNPSTQQFTLGTPALTGPITRTTAEPCIPIGVPLSSNTAPCDHNGVRFANPTDQPTNVVYRWLLADPQNPGALVPFATPVAIPQPVVSVIPPPQPASPPTVVFQIQLPPPPTPKLPPPAPQFGEAEWVKVFKTELDREVGLDELTTGNPVVPDDATTTETPWKLLQFNPHSANSGTLRSQAQLGSGSHAVIRRYEHYKYTGAYDALTHQAVCGGDGSCSAPLDGELGDYIGAQMAGANLGMPSVTVTKTGNGNVNSADKLISCGSKCTSTYTLDAPVTLTASPGSGSVFTSWGGACDGTQSTCALTVNDSLNVTATFTPTFTLSIGRSGSGTVTGFPSGEFGTAINCGSSCSAKFTQGSTVILSATPATGLHFANWSGACAGTLPTCSVVITKDTQAQATFTK